MIRRGSSSDGRGSFGTDVPVDLAVLMRDAVTDDDITRFIEDDLEQPSSTGRVHRAATSENVGCRRGAEGVGFEPTEGCPSHALQACRFVRSRIPPEVGHRTDEAVCRMTRSGPLAATPGDPAAPKRFR